MKPYLMPLIQLQKKMQKVGLGIAAMLSNKSGNAIHALDDYVWQALFNIIAETFKSRNQEQEYITDSFPVPVCDNIRISRSKIFQGTDFRGYIAGKRRYFYGIRVHMIVTASGEPVEFMIAAGAESDINVFKQHKFDLPEGSICYGDKAYNDYEFEDLLQESAGITLKPIRKKNSHRAEGNPAARRAISYLRKKIETSFSRITQLFPKTIHAVSSIPSPKPESNNKLKA